MSTKAKYVAVFLALCVLLLCSVGAYVVRRHGPGQTASLDTLLLLVPDSTSATDPMVRIWMDAASEEGLHLVLVRDSELLSPTSEVHGAGLIVPDEIHRIANDAVIGALIGYVQHGGKLMLVYDAATWNLHGAYAGAESRMSQLAGVRYAMYDTYSDECIRWSGVWGSADTMQALAIPPGKFVPMSRRETVAWRPVSAKDAPANTEFTLARYQYGTVDYPSYRTDGPYAGHVLLRSKAGIAAGYHPEGSGGVLFVNLPLGYLADRTDGLLLHSFLHYFAVKLLGLPYLASVPDGTGGLVLNWHIDARSALRPLALMRRHGLFSQGPFSEHITAGPDVDWPHDGRGFDIKGNAEALRWAQFFSARGDAIGSHGGWIHNYFGEHVSDKNEKEFTRYLEDNYDALKDALGSAPREYSAPLGNHPAWVTHWLEQHGISAYYFAGDSGMGPTQVWRDGVRDGSRVWAFPILHMGRDASLEEMDIDRVSSATVRDWLLNIADFAADERVARLVYSHPLGTTHFVPALQDWFQHTAQLQADGRFHWYTMQRLADFLNSRKEVSWAIA
ncbi:MAG: hypothetical protein JO187_07020, partial [Acidobacteria bacterium]|nr:hypothetical protein [Acidobacteriota bacterium]